MNISATTDIDFITNCILANYDWLTDDGDSDPDMYFPPFGIGIIYAKVSDNGNDLGIFLLERRNFIEYSVHTALLKSARGRAVEAGKAALEWAWGNTNAKRITTTVPSFNPLALRLALKVGFKEVGVNEHSFSKNGNIYDQTILGISKHENMP